MDTEITQLSKKRGRKPTGKATTSTERMRRIREREQTEGVKEFRMKVGGLHLEYVEALAKGNGIATSVALSQLLGLALDRYVVVMQRCQQMIDDGATDDQVSQYMRTFWNPRLSNLEEAQQEKNQ